MNQHRIRNNKLSDKVGERPLVAIVVLSFNNYLDTCECVESLNNIDYPNYKIFIVDNCSTDGSPQRLKDRFPDHCFICNDRNSGFAGGNNIGIKLALGIEADFVWIINNDTVVKRDALEKMVARANLDPSIGIVASKIFYYCKPDMIHFAGGKIQKWKGSSRHIGMGEIDDGRFNAAKEMDFATGASMLARADMIKEVGLMREDYFLYFEDTDWCLRAKEAGWKIVFEPEAHIWHKVNATTGNENPKIRYYVSRNRLICCKLHYKLFLPTVFVTGIKRFIISYFVRFFLKGFSSDELKNLHMGIRGNIDFIMGRRGIYKNIM